MKKSFFQIALLLLCCFCAVNSWSVTFWSPDVHGSIASSQILQLDGITDGGWWYSYTDSAQGGNSWVSMGNDRQLWSDSIDYTGMISVHMRLGDSTNGVGPSAGIGFPWVSEESGGGAYDISSMMPLGRIGIVYTSEKPMTVQIDWDTTTNGSSRYSIVAPVSSSNACKDLWFYKSTRPYIDSIHPDITITQALQRSTGLRFQIEGAPSDTSTLGIVSVASECPSIPGACPNMTCFDQTQIYTPVNTNNSAVKISNQSQTLRITGLTAPAQLTLRNLRGARVLAQTVNANSTVSLRGLPKGVYLVQVRGEGIQVRQRVVSF